MTKNELARELADAFEMPRRQVVEIVEAMLDRITEVLREHVRAHRKDAA